VPPATLPAPEPRRSHSRQLSRRNARNGSKRNKDALFRLASTWVVKVGQEAGSCNFPTGGCKIPTEEIMDDQNYNFPPPRMGISSHKFGIFGRIFPDKKKIFQRPKI